MLKGSGLLLLMTMCWLCYYSTMLKIGSKMWDLQLNKKQCNYNLVLILFSLGLDQLKNYSKIKDVHCAMIEIHIFLSWLDAVCNNIPLCWTSNLLVWCPNFPEKKVLTLVIQVLILASRQTKIILP